MIKSTKYFFGSTTYIQHNRFLSDFYDFNTSWIFIFNIFTLPRTVLASFKVQSSTSLAIGFITHYFYLPSNIAFASVQHEKLKRKVACFTLNVSYTVLAKLIQKRYRELPKVGKFDRLLETKCSLPLIDQKT